MSEPERGAEPGPLKESGSLKESGPEKEDGTEKNSGPNLVLLYSLPAFALLAAMGVAAMIVWPFYKAR